MKKTNRLSQGMKKQGILLLGISMIVIGMLIWYAKTLDEKLHQEIRQKLRDASEQNIITLQTEMKSQQNVLMGIAEQIGTKKEISGREAVKSLKKIRKRYSFKRMGIAYKDGEVYTTDNASFNISDRKYFQKSLKGESAVSQRLQDYAGGENIIVFSEPIFQKGEVKAVLFATYATDILKQIMSTTDFNGKASSYLVQLNGDLVASSSEIEDGKENIFKMFGLKQKENAQSLQQLQNALLKNKTDYIRVFDQEEKYMLYTPLNVNDWYLINIISANAMENTRNYIMRNTYVLFSLIIIMFTGAVFRIIHVEKIKNRQLRGILYVDPLTGGYSYQKFLLEAERILKQKEGKKAFIVMDLDQFKLINELFGHEKGDETLKDIFALWKQWLQPGEIFARRIADRFVVLAFYQTKEELLERIEQFILEVKNSRLAAKEDYVYRPKLGVYLIQDGDKNVEVIQNNAVMAYSMAKKSAGLVYTIYDDEFRNKILKKKRLEDRMERAFEKNEFDVYYQPQFDAGTGKMIGAEALIRWPDKDGRMVPPNEFIPIAEQSGFVVKLDQYVFTKVCEQQRKWQEEGKKLIPISVNLSREHLRDASFTKKYEEIQKKNHIPVSCIGLEITESALFENQDAFLQIVNELHRIGFKISIDDFGTGYSSLMMLEEIPMDVMKLDKSFIDHYEDKKGKDIIRCVIWLARNLKMTVVAEGVETQEQYEFLKALECDVIQGYYFARPMPAREMEKYWRKSE